MWSIFQVIELLSIALYAFTVAMLLLATTVSGYYLFLAACSLHIRPAPHVQKTIGPATDFAIVVPAHNEALVLGETLDSLTSQTYPADYYTIYVIADHCEDATVTVARSRSGEGVHCLERKGEEQRGKGQALQWAFEQVLRRGHDAVVVVDADCKMDVNALDVFNSHLQAGDLVLQANDVADNPDDSVISYVLAVGNTLENDLFYAPKSAMGLACLLRGTGMVFHRSILEAYPWKATTISEDTEYTITLLRQHLQVTFVPKIAVRSSFPSDLAQLRVQRMRWATGNFDQGKRHLFSLLVESLRSRNLQLADAGFTLFVLSRPLMLAQLACAVTASWASALLLSGQWSVGWLVWWSAALVMAQATYIVWGVAALGLTAHRLGFLFRSPLVLFPLLSSTFSGLVGAGRGVWAKTPRS